MDTYQLGKVCEILNYDFFQHLTNSQPHDINLDVARRELGGGKVSINIELNPDQQDQVLRPLNLRTTANLPKNQELVNITNGPWIYSSRSLRNTSAGN